MKKSFLPRLSDSVGQFMQQWICEMCNLSTPQAVSVTIMCLEAESITRFVPRKEGLG
jgi:hypothetical protein